MHAVDEILSVLEMVGLCVLVRALHGLFPRKRCVNVMFTARTTFSITSVSLSPTLQSISRPFKAA